ncbi:hypothetical protein CHCC5024_0538 [Bacillus licheniformis]|nr:hypothetical protein CHCC5024_0538 [Bacillus licheniformis]
MRSKKFLLLGMTSFYNFMTIGAAVQPCCPVFIEEKWRQSL